MESSEQFIVPSRDFVQLSDYEDWASQNWLHQNGTLDAQLHARGKMTEEINELIEALEIGKQDEIISEAGDVLWTSHASGLNSSVPLSSSIQEVYPTHFSGESLHVDQLDEVALEVFQGVDRDTTIEYLAHYERQLGKAAKQWFNLREKIIPDSDTFANTLIGLKRVRATHALANTALLVSYIAQEFADSRIKDVMQENYQKIEQRIKAGAAVTKQPRSN